MNYNETVLYQECSDVINIYYAGMDIGCVETGHYLITLSFKVGEDTIPCDTAIVSLFKTTKRSDAM